MAILMLDQESICELFDGEIIEDSIMSAEFGKPMISSEMACECRHAASELQATLSSYEETDRNAYQLPEFIRDYMRRSIKALDAVWFEYRSAWSTNKDEPIKSTPELYDRPAG